MNNFTINNNIYYIDNTLEANCFVGIKIINNQYHLFFPIGFKIKESNENYYKKIIRYLYKTVLLAKNIEEDKDKKNKLEREEEIPINSYIYILSDYFSNGIYKYNENKYKKDIRGNINWKRTFKNNFYIQDKVPVYLDTIIRYKKKDTNIISLLQIYCINKSIDMLIFMGNYNKIHSELTDQDINNNINYYNNILDKEIKNTNNDKKKLLLINIKSIINDCNYGDKAIRAFGTLNYQYSFEKMVNKLFGNIDDLSKYYPTALWYLKNKIKEFESSKLREDTIWIGEDKAYVIDSKYYRFGVDKDNYSLLPQTAAIHKQIVYGDYVHNKLKNIKNKDFKVYNIFIIPSNNDEFLEYIGYTKMKLLDDDKEFKYIYLLFINMNDLVDKYYTKECNQIEKIVNIIEKNTID